MSAFYHAAYHLIFGFFLSIVSAGFTDGKDATPRLGRIKTVGRVVDQVVSEGQAFSARFFPDQDSDPVNFASVPQLLSQGVAQLDRQNRSADRGAARIALALTKAWYSDADIHQVTEYFPTKDEFDNPIVWGDVLREVRGYATHVANMVDINKFYNEFSDPQFVAPKTTLAVAATAGDAEGEAAVAEHSPQDGRDGSRVAGDNP